MKPNNLSEPKFMTGPNRTVMGIPLLWNENLTPEQLKNAIPQLWNQFYEKGRRNEIPNRVGDDGPAFGICDRKMYIATIEVSSIGAIPKGMVTYDLEGGKYAVFTHKGTVDSVPQAMAYIHNEWLPKSGHKMRETPVFEYYDERFIPVNTPQSEFDIYVPIQ